MCTSATFSGDEDHYVGRNLDFEISYGQQIVVMPRNYGLSFRHMPDQPRHYAMIGMAAIASGYPLFFDATNEYGLSMEGLMYAGNAVYMPFKDGMDNLSSFELIPWLLCQCKTVDEAIPLLERINVLDEDFAPSMPQSPEHYLLADQHQCVTVEPDADGLHWYENPAGVMTNNPKFPQQLFNLNNYAEVSPKNPENRFGSGLPLDPSYSRGLGTHNLPGGMDSMSRFVKIAFAAANATVEQGEEANVGQFFHILHSVEQPKGLDEVDGDKFEYTIYSSCCNMDKGIYYYTTYYANQINAVDMHRDDLNSVELVCHPFVDKQKINWEN